MVFGMGRWGQALVHGNSSGCYMQLYSDLPEDVRVLVTGSSRIRRAILSEAISNGLGYRPEQVGDLAHPGVKLRLDYGLAEHFSNRQQIDLLIFEVWPEGPALRRALNGWSDTYETHGDVGIDYKAGLPISTLARQIFSEDSSLVFRAWSFLNTMVERATFSTSLVLDPLRTAQIRHTNLELGAPLDGTHCFLAIWDEPTERMQFGGAKHQAAKAENAERFAVWQDPDPLGFFDAEALVREHEVIRKVIALGNERDFATVFVYLPEIYVPLDQERLTERFAQFFGAPLLIPDDAVRAQLNSKTYVDPSHPNNEGREIIQAWLAKQLPTVIEGETRQ